MADCLWGLLDGMNEDGLSVSLTFGGRRVLGDGFGIPIVLRYLLETCATVEEARVTLARLPYSLSHNLTLTDRSGAVLTAYLSPDREPIFRPFPAATNHQGIVEWPEQARATRTIEREQTIVRLLDEPSVDADGFVDAFLRTPLFSTAYAHGFGTLYTAVYDVPNAVARIRWPSAAWELPLAGFAPHEHTEVLAESAAHADARLMRTVELRVRTGDRLVTDLSADVRAFAGEAGGDGLLQVFVPHATAGVALLETGSGSEADLADAVARVVPRDARYVHAHGSAGARRRPRAPRVRRALADPAGGRGRPAARGLAVGRPGGPERGQPGPHRAPQLPRGVSGVVFDDELSAAEELAELAARGLARGVRWPPRGGAQVGWDPRDAGRPRDRGRASAPCSPPGSPPTRSWGRSADGPDPRRRLAGGRSTRSTGRSSSPTGSPCGRRSSACRSTASRCSGSSTAPPWGTGGPASAASAATGRGEPIRVSDVARLDEAAVGHSAIEEWAPGADRDRLLGLVDAARRSRGLADAWGQLQVASGAVEVCVEHDPCGVWDWTPCVAIVTAAGGRVTTLTGRPWHPGAICW